MAAFTWTNNPIVYGSAITSLGLDSPFNELANAILVTPSNVDTSSGLTIWNSGAFGLSTANSAATNTTNLTAAISAVAAAGGGKIFIQNPLAGGFYQVNDGNFSFADQTNMEGACTGARFSVVPLGSNNLFNISHTGGNTRGVTFRDLYVTWNSSNSGYTFYSTASDNVHIYNTWIGKNGACFMDNNTLQSGMTDCTVDWNGSNRGNTAVTQFYCSQGYLAGCVLRQPGPGSGGPSGNIGVQLGSAATFFASRCHISQFDYAFKFLHGWSEVFIQSTRLNAAVCCIYFAQDSAALGAAAKFNGCITTQTNSATGTFPCIFIDTNGQNATQLEDVQFIGHTCHQVNGHGMQINSVNRLQIIGGRFSSCGLAGGTFANIYVTGGNFVDIKDADLSGYFQGDTAPNGGAGTTSPYAFIFDAGSSTVCSLTNCDLSGCGTGAVLVQTTPGTGNLNIRGCRGYNDQKTAIVSGTGNLPVGALNITSASAHGYYGPSQITFYGATNYSLNGTTYTITAGQIWLDSPWDVVYFTGSPTGTWIGR